MEDTISTNFYFNNIGASKEQLLVESLVIEAIKMYGIDMFYIPRTVVNRDAIYREPEYSTFDEAIAIEMYVRNVDGFDGEGEFLSKFGLEVRQQITFSVSIRSFGDEVSNYASREAPQEGDLVYLPLSDAVYQIKFVERRPVFFQLGALQTYDLVCELFEYSNEVFNTGILNIDTYYNNLSSLTSEYELTTEAGVVLTTEDLTGTIALETYDIDVIDNQAMNEIFETQAAELDIFDFTEIDPFSEGGRRA